MPINEYGNLPTIAGKFQRGPCLAALVVFYLLGSSVSAQDRWTFELDAAGAFPRGDFEDNLQDNGIGVRFFGGYSPGIEAPFTLGLDLGFFNYGREKYDGPFDCCDDLDEVLTSNEILTAHLVFRLQSRKGDFRPYLEGLVGIKDFSTKTRIYAHGDEDAIDSSTNFDDSVFSHGFGAGIAIPINGIFGDRLESKSTIMFQIAARYMFGGEAQYVPEDTVIVDQTTVSYAVAESDTDMLTTTIGVGFRF